jgi:hypothetical protein
MNLDLDIDRLKKLTPFGVPVAIIVGGWLLLISPTASANARAANDLDSLRQRLAQVRASVGESAPLEDKGDPIVAFEGQVAAGDASPRLVEQLSRLATAASATDLEIVTGEPVTASVPGGPQVAGGALPDPRFTLFPSTALSYTPVTMTFDAAFAQVGVLFWNLRNLATTMEIRTVDLTRPAEGADARVHVVITLFAYARDGVSTTSASAISAGFVAGPRASR